MKTFATYFGPFWRQISQKQSGFLSGDYLLQCLFYGYLLFFFSSLCFFFGQSRVTGRSNKIVPRPPPAPYSRLVPPARVLSNNPTFMDDERNQMVQIRLKPR